MGQDSLRELAARRAQLGLEASMHLFLYGAQAQALMLRRRLFLEEP
jgi:hypothetical protein